MCFPTLSFCVFHQLKKLTKIYLDKFKSIDDIPALDKKFYEICTVLILAKDAINSSVIFKELQDMASSKMSYTSRKAMKYAAEVYIKTENSWRKGSYLRLTTPWNNSFQSSMTSRSCASQDSQWLNKLDKQFADESQVIQHRIEVFLLYRSLFMDNS